MSETGTFSPGTWTDSSCPSGADSLDVRDASREALLDRLSLVVGESRCVHSVQVQTRAHDAGVGMDHVRQREVPDLVREGSAKGGLERRDRADLRQFAILRQNRYALRASISAMPRTFARSAVGRASAESSRTSAISLTRTTRMDAQHNRPASLLVFGGGNRD